MASTNKVIVIVTASSTIGSTPTTKLTRLNMPAMFLNTMQAIARWHGDPGWQVEHDDAAGWLRAHRRARP